MILAIMDLCVQALPEDTTAQYSRGEKNRTLSKENRASPGPSAACFLPLERIMEFLLRRTPLKLL